MYGDKRDRFGRRLAEVLLPDGRSLTRNSSRPAWRGGFVSIRRICELGELERQAREAKRGLWAELHAVPPWEWRDQKHIDRGSVPTGLVIDRFVSTATLEHAPFIQCLHIQRERSSVGRSSASRCN